MHDSVTRRIRSTLAVGLLAISSATALADPLRLSTCLEPAASQAPACRAVRGDRASGWSEQTRSETMATHGIVSTSHTLAAQAGYNEATGIQNTNSDPSPDPTASNVGNYINQEERINIEPTDGVVKVLRTDQKNLISDFITQEDLKAALRVSAARHDLVAVVAADPRERVWPAAGLVEWRDPETGAVHVCDTSDRRVREALTLQFDQQRTGLKQLLARTGLDVVEVWAGEPYDRELVRFFKARERRLRTWMQLLLCSARPQDEARGGRAACG